MTTILQWNDISTFPFDNQPEIFSVMNSSNVYSIWYKGLFEDLHKALRVAGITHWAKFTDPIDINSTFLISQADKYLSDTQDSLRGAFMDGICSLLKHGL
jgi:hypothetical protein